jgi:hypothetical protein
MGKGQSGVHFKPGFNPAEARDLVRMQREAAIGERRDVKILARKYRADPAYHEACRWVWQKRKEGLTPEAIAALSVKEFGEKITWPRVEAMIVAAYEDFAGDPAAQEMKILDNARLEWYLECLANRISAGDDKAINTAVRILERRSNMFGYDAPKKIHAHIEGTVDPELLGMVAEARDGFRKELAAQIPQLTNQDIEDAEIVDEDGAVDLDIGRDVEDDEL